MSYIVEIMYFNWFIWGHDLKGDKKRGLWEKKSRAANKKNEGAVHMRKKREDYCQKELRVKKKKICLNKTNSD